MKQVRLIRRFSVSAAVLALVASVGLVATGAQAAQPAQSVTVAPAPKPDLKPYRFLCLPRTGAPVPVGTAGDCTSAEQRVALTARESRVVTKDAKKALCVAKSGKGVRIINAREKCEPRERKVQRHRSVVMVSSPEKQTLISVPGAVAFRVATTSDLATVSVTDVETGGSPVTGIDYRLSADDGATWTSWMARSGKSFTIADLGPCTYEIELRGVNVLGAGPASAAERFALKRPGECVAADGVRAAMPAAPAAPSNVRVTVKEPRDGEPRGSVIATVRFSAPVDPGTQPITGYEYMLSTSGGDSFGDWTPTGSAGTTFQVTGLMPGETYMVLVRARNAVGAGAASQDATFGAPTVGTFAVTADGPFSSGTGSAIVTSGEYVATLDPAQIREAGSSIVEFQYRWKERDDYQWSQHITVDPTDTFDLASLALVLGDSYQVEIRARNASGHGPWQAFEQYLEPTRTPDAPGVTLGPVDGISALSASITATLTPPYDGGTPVTEYRYRSKRAGAGPEGWSDWSTLAVADGPTYTISGFEPGVAYDLEFDAVNADGAGPATEPGAFGAPVVALPTLDAGTFTSDARSDVITSGSYTGRITTRESAGSDITALQWRWADSTDADNWSAAADASADNFLDFTLDFTGRELGRTYLIEMRAVNATGVGPWSSSASVTPTRVPDAPVIVFAPQTGFAVVTNGFFNGGTPVTSYVYEWMQVPGGTWSAPVTSPASQNPLTVQAPPSGEAYMYRFAAVNAVGQSAWSDPLSYVTDPTAPSIARVTPTASGATLEVNPPTFRGGADIVRYDIEVSSDSGVTWATPTVTGSDSPFTVSGLTSGRDYMVRVRAVNEAQLASPWVTAQFRTNGIPAAPTLTGATLVGTAADVNFTPGPNGGAAITGYVVELSNNGQVVSSGPAPLSGTTSPIRVAGLAGSGSTWIRMAAENEVGRGPWSDWFEVTALAPPTSVTLGYDDAARSVAVSWPAVSGVSGYEVRYATSAYTSGTPGSFGAPQAVVGTQFSIAATQGLAYYVQVRSVGASGPGSWSTTARVDALGAISAPIITGVDYPLVPGAASSRYLAVSWRVPSTGGWQLGRYSLTCAAGFTAYTSGGAVSGTSGTTSGNYCSPNESAITLTVFDREQVGSGSTSFTISAPTVPTGVVAQVQGTTADVSFTAGELTWPRVSGYQYRLSSNGGSTWMSAINAGAGTSFSVTGLMAGSDYQVQVRGTSSAGAGQWSAPATFTVGAVPAQLSGLQAASTPAGISVSFSPAPMADQVLRYEYQIRSSAPEFGPPTSIGTVTTAVVDGLTAGASYDVQVRAVNAIGAGPWSATATSTAAVSTRPGAPTATASGPGGTTVTIVPTFVPEGDPIVTYGLNVNGEFDQESSDPNIEVTVLPGEEIWVAPYVITASGQGSPLGERVTVPGTPAVVTAPGQPTLSLAFDPRTSDIVWTVTPSQDSGGFELKGYEIELTDGESTVSLDVLVTSNTSPSSGMANWNSTGNVTARVRTQNLANLYSAWSTPVSITIPMVTFAATCSADGDAGAVPVDCAPENDADAMLMATAQSMMMADDEMMPGCVMVDEETMHCPVNAMIVMERMAAMGPDGNADVPLVSNAMMLAAPASMDGLMQGNEAPDPDGVHFGDAEPMAALREDGADS